MSENKTMIRSVSGTYVLRGVAGDHKNKEYLIKDGFKVGREQDNDIIINEGFVSRHHAAIKLIAGLLTVTDNNSANGTFVNDKPVETAVLADGDKVRFDIVEFMVCDTSRRDEKTVIAGPAERGAAKADAGNRQAQLEQELAQLQKIQQEREEQLRQEKQRLAQLEQEKAEQQRIAREKAEQAERDRIAKEKKAEQERIAREQAEQAERDRIAKEKKAEQERIAKEKAEQAERDRIAKEKKAEQERIAREKAEQAERDRIAKEKKAEQERLAREKAEQAERDRIAKEKKAEQERIAREQAEQAERDRIAKEKKAEQERIAKEQAEQAERDRIAKEKKAEQERIAKEQAEQAERDRIAKEKKPEQQREPLPEEDGDKTVFAPLVDSTATDNGDDSEKTMMAPAIEVPAASQPQDELSTVRRTGVDLKPVVDEDDDGDKTVVGSPLTGAENDKTLISSTMATVVDDPTMAIGEETVNRIKRAAALNTQDVALLGLTEPVIDRRFKLNKSLITVGRSPFNDIIIKSSSVSSQHAELEKIDDLWVVRDLASSNGTYINDQLVDEAELYSDDCLAFGEVELTFDPNGQMPPPEDRELDVIEIESGFPAKFWLAVFVVTIAAIVGLFVLL